MLCISRQYPWFVTESKTLAAYLYSSDDLEILWATQAPSPRLAVISSQPYMPDMRIQDSLYNLPRAGRVLT
jgi:hypothetical protein